MSLLVWICLLASGTFTSFADAAVNQDELTPEGILARARLSRVEFSDAVFELRMAIPEMYSKEKVAPFLRILEELRLIQVELNFAAFDSDMLADLSNRMTSHIELQLDIRKDPEWMLVEFARWADEGTRGQFCNRQVGYVLQSRSVAEIIGIAQRLTALLTTLSKPLPLGVGVPPSVDDLLKLENRVFKRLVDAHFEELQPADYEEMLALVDRPAALDGMVDSLGQLVYLAPEWLSLAKVTDIAMKTREHLLSLPAETFPGEVLSRCGTVLGVAMLKIIERGETVDVETGSRIMGALAPVEVDALGAGILAIDPSSHQAGQLKLLATVARTIASHFEAYGLRSQRDAMAGLARRFSLGAWFHEQDLEGIYAVNIGGKEGILTVARTDNTGVVVALGYGHVTFSMAHSTLDEETGQVYASSVVDTLQPPDSNPGQPEIPPQSILFRLVPPADDGQPVTVEGSVQVGMIRQTFSGQRIRGFADLLKAGPLAVEDITREICGAYEGALASYQTLLRISASSSGLVASLLLSPESTRQLVGLDRVYVNSRLGVVYLTSRVRSAFLQLRLRYERGRLVGQLVIGGRSQPTALEFIKVGEDAYCGGPPSRPASP